MSGSTSRVVTVPAGPSTWWSIAAVMRKPLTDQRRRGDGLRMLVDRLWPRGLSRERADLDEWCKDVAPSPELRKWHAHDPELFTEFRRCYRAELHEPHAPTHSTTSRTLARRRNLTLLTATKLPEISEAAVLRELLDGR